MPQPAHSKRPAVPRCTPASSLSENPRDGGDAGHQVRWNSLQICGDQIQPASIDLRLGDFAYPVDASFLPGKGKKVLEKMRELDADFERFGSDLRNGAVLEKRPPVRHSAAGPSGSAATSPPSPIRRARPAAWTS